MAIRPIIPTGFAATQADVDAGLLNNLRGQVTIVDASGVDTGKRYAAHGGAVAPVEAVDASNINTVLASAGGAGWEKVQATTSNYVITRPASGAGLDLHIEAGTLAALTAVSWPVPAAGVDQLRVRNFSGAAKTLSAGAGWTMVTADGNPLTSGSYSIPDDRAVEVTLDPQGFAQVVPWGGEVTQAEFTAGLAGKSATSHAHTKADVGLGSVDNTADAGKPVSTAQQTALNLKQDASTAATDAELTAHTGNALNPHGVTASQVGLGSVTNTSDANKPVSTAQQAALDAKQATLVSGTNIKTVNGASVVGSGNVAVAADLPGGTAQTATNDGLATTGSPTSTTVTTDTVLQFNATGSFTVPIGVTSMQVLVVGGGAGGAGGVGGGGGGGRLVENAALSVTPGASHTVTVGAGGAAGAATPTSGGTGGTSSFGTLVVATGGGGGGSNNTAGNTGGSGGGGGSSQAGGAASAGASTGGDVAPTGYGFAGGTGADNGAVYEGAGGGGAGGVGSNGSPGTGAGGDGGAGRNSTITGSTVGYAGGGGGGTTGGQKGSATHGGGSLGAAGTANTGGGGGSNANSVAGGAGGSGVVIVRFPTQTRTYQALTSYADNTAAKTGGLLVGQFYRLTATSAVMQVT